MEEEQALDKAAQKEQRKKGFKEFLKWYVHIDFKDVTNYIALALAIFLLWWGIKTIIKSLSMKGP